MTCPKGGYIGSPNLEEDQELANRTVQSVKNSLKFKAQPKAGILSVKVGVKKYQVPVEARMLSGEGYMFLSFPAVSELFRMDGKTLKAMSPTEDANAAFEKLNPGRRRGRRRASHVEMPSALAEALKNLPSGFKLGYGADGSPKLVKTRKRTPRKAKAGKA
jgi:hypothetical protein